MSTEAVNAERASADRLSPDRLSEDTRMRLLDAGGRVFAENGYKAAKVRDICAEAGANIAAVNYHFGDKLSLYTEVLRHVLCMEADEEFRRIASESVSPEQKLRKLVIRLMKAMNDRSRPSWPTRLVLHEMAQPTPALPAVVDEMIKPRYDLLCRIVGNLIGRSPSDTKTHLCAHSIVGQIRHYAFGRDMLTRLWKGLRFTDRFSVEIADHIISFSLAGLADVAKQGNSRKDAGKARLHAS